MSARDVDIRVFAEGVRIPSLSVVRTQSRMGGIQFTVNIPPTPVGFSVLPGTLIHVFVKRRQTVAGGTKAERYVLFAEGRVRGRRAGIAKGGQRNLSLECQGIDSEWKHIPIGFDIGFDTSFTRPRLKALFHGLSPTTFEQDYIPRLSQVMNYQVYRVLSGGGQTATDPFFDLKSVVNDLIKNHGPAIGIAQTISMISRVHPLERQSMYATRFFKRLVAIENGAFTKHLRNKDNYEKLKGRIDSMSPSKTTLRQLVDTVLPATYHHQFSIGSPYFNKALYAEVTGSDYDVDDYSEKEEVVDQDLPQGSDRGQSGPSSNEFDSDPREIVLQTNAWPSSHYDESKFDCKWPGHAYYKKLPSSLRDNARRLAHSLETLSRYSGHVHRLTSTYRSDAHNKKIGGVGNSQHLYCRAADIVPGPGQTPAELFVLLDRLMSRNLIEQGGLGYYPRNGFVHYDIRGSRAYWMPGGGNALAAARRDAGVGGSDDEVAPVTQTVTYSTLSQEAEWEASGQAGVMPSVILKPNMHFSPPPISNVFFGDQVTTAQVGESYDHAFSRMMMVAPSLVQKLIEPGNPMAAMFTPLYFVPNHLQGIVDSVTEGPTYSDVRLKGYDPETQMDQAAEQAKKQLGSTMDLSTIDPNNQKALLARATLAREQKDNAKRDVLAKMINGSSDLPDLLIGMYTYEELFKGIRPVVSRLPYMQKSTDPEEWVAIYGHYTYAMLARQARITNLSMPLNLDVAVGFSGAFYDHTMGWILGEVEQVQDSISAEGQATTTVQLGGCAFYGDLDNPSWNRIYEDNQGAFDNYTRDGQQAPTLFDEAFAPGNVGTSLYEGVLGVGSVIDRAKKLSGKSALTLRESLEVLQAHYEAAQSPASWVASQFTRPIATEGEVMQLVLEAEPEFPGTGTIESQTHERYNGTYRAHEWPNGAAFVTERRFWAEDYKRDLEVRESAIDAVRPTLIPYASKGKALPNEAATDDYNSVLSKRGNASPSNDFLK